MNRLWQLHVLDLANNIENDILLALNYLYNNEKEKEQAPGKHGF